MNSTKKGDCFEKIVFEYIKLEINGGRLLFQPDLCKVFQKKKYYSKDRGGDIVFDISIEVYLPEQDNYSLLYLIECKHYAEPIPVNDAEEFFSKMQQVGAHKGAIAASNNFQSGTYNYCQSKKIGLLRYFDSSNFKWELNRAHKTLAANETLSISDPEIKFTSENYKPKYSKWLFYHQESNSKALPDFIFHQSNKSLQATNPLILLPPAKSAIKYLSTEAIEATAEKVLKSINYDSGEVGLEKIYLSEHSSLDLTVRLENDLAACQLERRVLGKISFNPPTITIFPHNCQTSQRLKFTLAHELGHYYLGHEEYLNSEYYEMDDVENTSLPTIHDNGIDRLEWQANFFASCLLHPKAQFTHDVLNAAKQLELRNHGHGIIYLDNQPCNLNTFKALIDYLQHKYKTSPAALRIRLIELKLLNDQINK